MRILDHHPIVRASVVVVCLFLMGLLGGCSSPPPKASESPRQVETAEPSIPEEISKQLLDPADIRDGASLKSTPLPTAPGESRLLIRGDGRYMCSPTGNCPYWVFRQTSSGYVLELDLGVAQDVTIETGKTPGSPGLVARQHGSATSSEVRVYEFDGSRYHLVRCMIENYQNAANPDRPLEKPGVEEVPCGQP